MQIFNSYRPNHNSRRNPAFFIAEIVYYTRSTIGENRYIIPNSRCGESAVYYTETPAEYTNGILYRLRQGIIRRVYYTEKTDQRKMRILYKWILYVDYPYIIQAGNPGRWLRILYGNYNVRNADNLRRI